MNSKFRKIYALSALATVLACALPQTSFADVYVIANPAAAVSAGDIKDIYLGEKNLGESLKKGLVSRL